MVSYAEGMLASWQDGEAGRPETAIQEIAVEVVTSAEISYREGCVRGFDWRVRRRAQLEEDARNHQQEVEREERDRRQQLEQARIDRLLDEAARCDERWTSGLTSLPSEPSLRAKPHQYRQT